MKKKHMMVEIFQYWLTERSNIYLSYEYCFFSILQALANAHALMCYFDVM